MDASEVQAALPIAVNERGDAASLAPQVAEAVAVQVVVHGMTGEVILGPMRAATIRDVSVAAAGIAQPGQILRLLHQEVALDTTTKLRELAGGSEAADFQLCLQGVWEYDWVEYALDLAFRFFSEWFTTTRPDAFPILTLRPGPAGSGVVATNHAGFNIDWMDNLQEWASGETRWHRDKTNDVPDWTEVAFPPEEAWAQAAERFQQVSQSEIESRLGLKVKEFRSIGGYRDVKLEN